MRRRELAGRRSAGVSIAVAVAVILGVLTAPANAAPPNPDTDGPAIDAQQTRPALESIGSTSLRAIAASHAGERAVVLTNGPEIPNPKRPNAVADLRVSPAATPNPGTTPVAGREAGSLTFQALTHTDSRFANNGNQFSGEPPDQALCVGNGFTFEMVNQVVTVYSGIGAQLVPEATINEFYGLAPNITRTDPPSFGPFVFDPVCLYDAQLQRWFVVNTALEQDPVTGEFTGVTRLYIAVSATSDPTGIFASYTINTTRGDATDRNCPCFDDFPHIGADANGFYITTNRVSLCGPNFNGAQIYAASKQRLAAAAAGNGRLPQVVSMNAGPVNGNPSFTVQPATVPPGGQFIGREYFLSTLDYDTVSEKQIAVWALANTASLDSANPSVRLTRKVISSLEYSFEPDTVQKPGPHPLGESVGESLNRLDSASDMTEVTFAAGKLWAATTTAIGAPGAPRPLPRPARPRDGRPQPPSPARRATSLDLPIPGPALRQPPSACCQPAWWRSGQVCCSFPVTASHSHGRESHRRRAPGVGRPHGRDRSAAPGVAGTDLTRLGSRSRSGPPRCRCHLSLAFAR